MHPMILGVWRRICVIYDNIERFLKNFTPEIPGNSLITAVTRPWIPAPRFLGDRVRGNPEESSEIPHSRDRLKGIRDRGTVAVATARVKGGHQPLRWPTPRRGHLRRSWPPLTGMGEGLRGKV